MEARAAPAYVNAWHSSTAEDRAGRLKEPHHSYHITAGQWQRVCTGSQRKMKLDEPGFRVSRVPPSDHVCVPPAGPK